MNEEIKKEFEEKYPELIVRTIGKTFSPKDGGLSNIHTQDIRYDVWYWIDQKLKEQYLQGAIDMGEAVKIGKVRSLVTEKQLRANYWDGYDDAIDELSHKAQQFIDSLEKGEKK